MAKKPDMRILVSENQGKTTIDVHLTLKAKKWAGLSLMCLIIIIILVIGHQNLPTLNELIPLLIGK
jgi:hypothetical protein